MKATNSPHLRICVYPAAVCIYCVHATLSHKSTLRPEQSSYANSNWWPRDSHGLHLAPFIHVSVESACSLFLSELSVCCASQSGCKWWQKPIQHKYIASTSINTMLRHLYCMTLPTCTHMPPLSNRLPVAGFTRKNKFTIMTILQPRQYDAYTLAVHDAAYMHPHASTEQ